MKKRLLSAALALAMVLTLLPMSVFAAVTTTAPTGDNAMKSGSSRVTYYAKPYPEKGITDPGYYYEFKATKDDKDYTYYKVETGVVSGCGTNGNPVSSGTWYADLNWGTQGVWSSHGVLSVSSFTLLGNVTVGLTLGCNITVDLNGKNLSLDSTTPIDWARCTGITLYDNQYIAGKRAGTAPTQGQLTTTINHDHVDKSFTLTLEGAKTGAVTLKGNNTHTVNVRNYGETGKIDLAGVESVDKQYKQTVEGTTNAVIAEIAAEGNTSSISLTDTLVGSGSGAIALTGTGTKLTVAGSSNVGVVTLSGSQSTDKASATAPDVDINGGTVAEIKGTSGDTLTGAYKIDVNSQGTLTKLTSADMKNVELTIAGGTLGLTGNTLHNGKLNISGNSAKVGAIELVGAATDKVEVTVTGSNHNVGAITKGAAGTVSKLSIPADNSNVFASIDVGDYQGKEVKGGSFTAAITAAHYLYLDSSLFYQANGAKGWQYFAKDKLSEAIAYTTTPGTAGNLGVVGHAINGTGQIALKKDSSTTLATIGISKPVSIDLPKMVNGTGAASWTDATTGKNPVAYVPGVDPYVTDGTEAISLTIQADAGVATKLTNATASSDSYKDMGVSLVGDTITLTGTIPPAPGGTSIIKVTVTTDLMKADGSGFVTQDVLLSYDHNAKKVTFDRSQTLANGMYIKDANSLYMPNGTTFYKVSANLSEQASKLKVDTATSNEIVATINVSDLRTEGEKKALKDQLEGATTPFAWANSPAVSVAINAAMAGISNSQIEQWVKAAQRAAWTNKNSGTYKEDDHAASTGYAEDQVYLVIYLAVNATNYRPNGSLTATLVPSYRVEVRTTQTGYKFTADANHPNGWYLAQSGRALPGMSGDLTKADGTGGVEVTFNFTSGSALATSTYIHQDSTYVYPIQATQKYVFTKAGANGGLGTIVLNNVSGTVELKPEGNATTPKTLYDSLQAAVDDTKPRAGDLDEIEVSADYGDGKNATFNVTGLARKFKIVTKGNHTLSQPNNNYTVDVGTDNHTYTIQLLKDVVTTGNITISSADGGSASVNANPAKVGSTVTITLSASAGYTASGVSVKTSSGQTVSVSGSGSSYTFTMPSGSVTVTPSFTKTNTNATISVNRAITGTGTASTNASGQVSPGTQVTVTTTPGAGQRTMGLSVTGATAIRTGVNTFTFTVPSGYSTVTVTPSFDANNNTIFADVWSSSYYSKAVSWAVNKNPQVTNGSDTYSFSPEDVCNRAQMVTFLWRAAGRPSVAGIANPFVDVSATQTPGDYYSAILWAVSQGITDGTDRTHFSPYATVTRGQAVTFLYRYEKSPAASTNSGFYDVSSREYYARPVSWANAKGVTKGTSTTMFSPNDPVTRAQAVTFLYRDVTGDIA